jgi:hypothetical protein
MNIGEYRTVRAGNFKDLDETVNKLLADGFQPYGSPYVTESAGEFLACQAMVKEARGKSSRVNVGGI